MKTNLKSQTPFLNAARHFVFQIALIMIAASAASAQTNTFPSSGNAGVGTLSPAAPLDVQTNSATPNTLVGRFGNNNASGGGVVRVYSGAVSSSTLYPSFELTDQNYWVAAVAADRVSGLRFRTGVNIGSGAANLSDRMVITPTGSVGIGTISPAEHAKFHLYGSGGFGQDIQTSTNDWTRLRFVTPARTWGFFLDGGAGGVGSGKFGLYDYTANAFRMTFDTSGYMGLGTMSPTSRLHISGQADNLLHIASTGSAASDTVANFTSGIGNIMIVRGNGNVGIGGTVPNYKLDVQGGLINASGGLCIAGDCKTAWSQVGGGGSSQWTTSGSNIYYNSGNVAVGTTSPLALFDVRNSDGMFYAAFGYGANKETFLRAGNAATGVIHIGDVNTTKTLLQESGGNVGIGTTAPTEKLHVQGNGKVTGNLTVDGNINAKYQDVAEWVPSSEQLVAGTVVVLDTTKSNQVVSATVAYDTRVAGVISAQPGITLGEGGEGKVLVATTGRVRVKVDASRGAIQIGDLLVTSDVSGVAMKSEAVNLGGVQIHRPGTIIGKALEPLAKGQGEILVLLSLQ